MKKAIIIILIIVALTMLYVNRTVKNLEKLDFSVDAVKIRINNAQDILAGLFSGFSTDLTFFIRNTSNQNFNLDSLYLEIFTVGGSLIARPEKVINKISIPKNSDATIILSYNIDISGLFKILETSVKSEAITMLKSYLNTGYLGKKVMIKGKAKKSFANIDFEFETEI